MDIWMFLTKFLKLDFENIDERNNSIARKYMNNEKKYEQNLIWQNLFCLIHVHKMSS